MRFSFDLDGVLYERTDMWREIMLALKAAGHEVGVLSGHHQHSEDHVRKKLVSMGFPVIDFYRGREGEMLAKNGAVMKAAAIEEMGIALHFDDFDFGNAETERLFHELADMTRVARVTSRETWDEH